MIKLCVWMNIPSHHQSAFFMALNAHNEVDLKVRYFGKVSRGRVAEGWHDDYTCQPYERYVGDSVEAVDLLATLHGWEEFTHIISSNFSPRLVNYFCTHNVRWCHWSEMPGIRLAELIGFRVPLFRMLNSLMLASKRREGRRIREHALGVFGQGRLAHRAFRRMGVPERMIADLYYAPAALHEADSCPGMLSFSKGRKIFLSVGALCRRKGTDVLLKAFAKLDTEDWCLVLCGLDRADGVYQQLAQKLGIEDRVLFLGAYPVDRISEVYSAADVFVLASRFDGWGAVLNEAASLGLPVIGTDLCGASWHAIEPEVNGFQVQASSVFSLKNAMQTYVEDPVLCLSHGKASKERLTRMFTPERNAERLVWALQAWSR